MKLVPKHKVAVTCIILISFAEQSVAAAHCWYDDGEASTSAYFTPGYSAAAYPHRPHGTAEVVAAKLPTGASQRLAHVWHEQMSTVLALFTLPIVAGAAYTTCNSTSYVECSSLSDYAVFFLNRTFDDVDAISYGYSTTIPETQTVYTAGYPGGDHHATVAYPCAQLLSYTLGCVVWSCVLVCPHYDAMQAGSCIVCAEKHAKSGCRLSITTIRILMILVSSHPGDKCNSDSTYTGQCPMW